MWVLSLSCTSVFTQFLTLNHSVSNSLCYGHEWQQSLYYFCRSYSTEKRRYWSVNVIWPWFITCCLRFLKICRMRHSSVRRETCLSSFLLLNWPERLPHMKGMAIIALFKSWWIYYFSATSYHHLLIITFLFPLLFNCYHCSLFFINKHIFYRPYFLYVFPLSSLSMAASTFKDFELASTQRPDSVLRRRRRQKQAALESSATNSVVAVAQPSAARRFVRLAVMGLTVALGAAALAVVNTALEWAPKLDLFPWTAPPLTLILYLPVFG